MKKRLSYFILLFTAVVAVLSSCKKINESTTLGDDIIPGVDGVTTFDTILTVEAFNELFTATNDSLISFRADNHILGYISNDPLFGKTNAKIFLELKPPFYKWLFSGVSNPDSLYFDSCVLVLGWRGTYGDTTVKQRIEVRELNQAVEFRIDSAYQIREDGFSVTNFLGFKDIFPYELNDSVKVFRDTTVNQLRIRLDNTFGEKLLKGPGFDTSGAYASDSAFKTKLRGFAIEANQGFGGNALMAFGLTNEPNTKLAIYYRYTKNGKTDTTVSYFEFTAFSAQHNYIDRFGFAGTPLLAAQGGIPPDNLVYLINAPGSYATLKIPDLRNLGNRIVHRAELIVEQVYDVSDKTFIQPEALFLDVYDSSLSKHKVIPYDFIPERPPGANYQRFGMFGKNTNDGFGNPIRIWKFNVSRYVQNILNKKEPLHNFRLFTHRFISDQVRADFSNNTGDFTDYVVEINSQPAIGRVRVGGGNHATQKMRLRIIYSKI